MARGVVEGCSHGAKEMSIVSVERWKWNSEGRRKRGYFTVTVLSFASKPLREAGQEPGEGRKSDFDKDRFIYMNRGQEGQKTGSIVSDCRVRVKYCIAT